MSNYLYNYLKLSQKKEKDKKNKNLINKYLKKSFFNKESTITNRLLYRYKKKLNIKEKISNNVIIVENLFSFLPELNNDENIFILTKESEIAFNKNYDDFLSKKKKIFYEKIKNGKILIKIIKNLKQKKLQIVCIGGGKVSDLAKYISFKTSTSLINIPTILATHVYTSPKIHILKPIKDLGYNLTIDGKASNLSLIDIRTISMQYKKEPRFILSGLGDLIAFFNSKYDWMLSNNYKNYKNKFIFKSIIKVEKILKKIDINRSIKIWLKDYIFAQVLLCNITDWAGSAPASGSEHFFANLYEKKYPKKILHGELVAIGTLIFLFLRKKRYDLVLKLIKKFKINNSLKKLYLTKNKILDTLVLCKKEGIRKNRNSLLNIKEIKKNDFKKLINDMISKKIIKV